MKRFRVSIVSLLFACERVFLFSARFHLVDCCHHLHAVLTIPPYHHPPSPPPTVITAHCHRHLNIRNPHTPHTMYVITRHRMPPGGIAQLLSSPSHRLSTAINEYSAIVQRADHFKQAYSNVHTCVHYEDTSLREIERLRHLLIPQDHEKLKRKAVHFRGVWVQYMDIHRGHWTNALKELKEVKEKVSGRSGAGEYGPSVEY